jgi:hypothetical protein
VLTISRPAYLAAYFAAYAGRLTFEDGGFSRLPYSSR